MQIVSSGDNLHEMPNLFSGKNKKNIWKCHLLKCFPRVLIVKHFPNLEQWRFRLGCTFNLPVQSLQTSSTQHLAWSFQNELQRLNTMHQVFHFQTQYDTILYKLRRALDKTPFFNQKDTFFQPKSAETVLFLHESVCCWFSLEDKLGAASLRQFQFVTAMWFLLISQQNMLYVLNEIAPPHWGYHKWGNSNECPKRMFSWRNDKNTLITLLSKDMKC